MKENRFLRKELDKYLRIPYFLLILLVIMNVIVYYFNTKCGLIVSGSLGVYLICVTYVYISKRPNIISNFVALGFAQGSIQTTLLKELSVPYSLVDSKGRVLWSNKAFYDTVKSDRQHMRKHIQNIFTDITLELFDMDEEECNQRIVHIFQNERNYRVCIHKLVVQEMLSAEMAENVTTEDSLFAIYFYDETDLIAAVAEKEKIKMVVGHIYIDNYEEAMDSTEEVRRSLLVALVERKIMKYMQTADAVIKRLEKDKFIFVCQQQHLEQLQQGKFSLLDEVRNISIGNETPLTLSIAVGVDPESDDYATAYEYSHMAMDMALGRGGDQAVVKLGEKILYYGGKTQSSEKNTRVKARVKAHAFKEIMMNKDDVIIMGHQKPDIDCLGSAIGIYRLATVMDKKAHIVINEITSSIRPAMNSFLGNTLYPEDMFYNSEQALEAVNPNTLLIIVDVNRPGRTECEELLAHTKNIVVIDHHRQSGDIIEHATLSYVEPYASSSCEMIAEILQYSMDKPKLRPVEADTMYAGILVDTDNFVTKTGVRTFEAASFLRKCGADMTRVRKAYRSDLDSYRHIAEGVSRAEIFLESFAISDMPAEDTDSPTVLAAKVANELLDIDAVRASFVMTKIDNTVFISARSIDDVNVQIIMEKFGGGGHGTVAGAQIEDKSIDEVRQDIKDLLEEMCSDGEI